MAFAHVLHDAHENGAGSSATVAVTLAAVIPGGTLVFVSVGWASNSGDTITQIVDDKSNTYTLVDRVRNTTAGYSWQTAYLDGINNRPITITATISSSRTFASIIVGLYTGGRTGNSIDGHAINTQTNPGPSADVVTSTNFTPVTNNDLIYGTAAEAQSVGTTTAGTNFTIRLNNLGASFCTEDRTLATAAAIAATFTSNTAGVTQYLTGGFAIKPWPLPGRRTVINGQSIIRASSW